MVKIKKGVNPIGKEVYTSNDVFGGDMKHHTNFKVLAITRLSSFIPTDESESVVYLKASSRRLPGIPVYAQVLLSELPHAFIPNSDGDEFWEVSKGDGLHLATHGESGITNPADTYKA